MTLEQVRDLLRRECEKAGGQARWARAKGISPAYVSDVLQGRREPGPRVLAPLGLARVVVYQRAAGAAES